VILGMIVTMFPGKAEQARALGVYSFVAAGGASIGLLAGGVLTQAVNWHWIFFVNVPIGVAAVLLGVRLIADDLGIGLSGGADVPGALLVIAAVSLGVFTVVGAADHGWTSPRTLGLAAVAVVLLAGFLAREATARTPLVPLRVFRERSLSVANLIQFLMVAGMMGMFFLGALYLQRVLGFSAIQVGLAFLPVAVSIAALSLRLTPWLVTRFGPRPVLVPGLVLIGLGLAGFARVPVDASYPGDVLGVMLVLGIGAGLSFPALMELAMTGSSEHDSGLRSGLANTTLQVGGAFGLAVLATLSTRRTAGLLARGAEQAEALTGGYRLAFGVGAGFVLVALALAVVGLRVRQPGRVEESLAAEEPQRQVA
jgi:MFS family permease